MLVEILHVELMPAMRSSAVRARSQTAVSSWKVTQGGCASLLGVQFPCIANRNVGGLPCPDKGSNRTTVPFKCEIPEGWLLRSYDVSSSSVRGQ